MCVAQEEEKQSCFFFFPPSHQRVHRRCSEKPLRRMHRRLPYYSSMSSLYLLLNSWGLAEIFSQEPVKLRNNVDTEPRTFLSRGCCRVTSGADNDTAADEGMKTVEDLLLMSSRHLC